MKKKIPVVIINWNGIEDTITCMDHVFDQTEGNLHIYLLDNGSDNNEGMVLQEKYKDHPNVTVILNSQNFGFTRASNQIFRDCILPRDYDFVVLLNNDAFPNNDWIEQLLTAQRETGADMISSKLINFFDRRFIDNTGHFMLNTGEVIPDGFGAPVDSRNIRKYNIGACAGAALYKVDMLKKIGLFDEYFHTGYEDAEFGIRAVITGHKSVYEPKAICYHKMSISVNKIRTEEYMVKIQSSIFYSYLKLMPTAVIAINLPFIIFRTAVLMGLFIVFNRPGYIRIYKKSLSQIIYRDKDIIKQRRKEFFEQCKTLNSLQIMMTQRFFLVDNIRRFFLYFVKGERTIFEKTNQN